MRGNGDRGRRCPMWEVACQTSVGPAGIMLCVDGLARRMCRLSPAVLPIWSERTSLSRAERAIGHLQTRQVATRASRAEPRKTERWGEHRPLRLSSARLELRAKSGDEREEEFEATTEISALRYDVVINNPSREELLTTTLSSVESGVS